MKNMICRGDRRRETVRAKTRLNGLDYLEVSDDQLTLTVYFLGKAPPHLSKDSFRIEGGRRVRGIRIVDARTFRDPEPGLDDQVKLSLDRFGDFSTYTLRLVNPAEPIDPRYDHLDFTFKINCPGDLDCKTGDLCPPEVGQPPDINYLAKDYAGFRRLILDRLALVMPDWRERHIPDLGIALVETLAYTGDYLSYYQDAVATEAYLDTARKRISVRRHARLVDYRMHEGCNARVWICVQVSGRVSLDPADLFFAAGDSDTLHNSQPVLSRDALGNLEPDAIVAFEPLVADGSKRIELYEAHNRISFYTWGQCGCCLPRGAVSATLRDAWADEATESPEEQASQTDGKKKTPAHAGQDRARRLRLTAGDVLIFQEMLGPKTGDASDADPRHRHAVRLTRVEPGIDPLNGTPVVEIQWPAADALPFPLCLSAMSDAGHGCIYNTDVTIARGNVVLADHGLTIDDPHSPHPSEVPVAVTRAECFCEERPGDVTRIPGGYRPKIAKSPITCRQPADFSAPASSAMHQDPRLALPQVGLASRRRTGSMVSETPWEPRFDLLHSSGRDAHFVVEIDDQGAAHLRFGDGECGRLPEAGTRFAARYRIGNGKAGNLGPEAITHLVHGNEKPDGIQSICNPLPAVGGVEPEPIREVKLLAPSTFRKQLRRAITAADYACIAERDAGVQKAGAVLRWNGSWHEARVAIDPLGRAEAGQALLKKIKGRLLPFRRMGHDLCVAPAQYVSLDIEMEICVKPAFLRGHVRAALMELFGRRAMPTGRPGFFHPDNLTFGAGIFASRLIAAASSVEGVENARVTRLERQYEGPHSEIENGVLPLGPLEIARCDNDPNYPEHGRLDLNVRGGR